MTDILSVLYTDVMKYNAQKPEWDGRDRFVLSKGHACVSYYATLALAGFYPIDDLETYAKKGSPFLCHISHYVPGVEFSAGSLGHGLPIAAGLALAGQRQKKEYKTYVLLGDGEMDEGSNWEAIMFAAHNKLDNLCLIIDKNKIQALGDTKDVLCLDPLDDKLNAFQWNVIRIDGHNYESIISAFEQFKNTKDKPTVIICDTIKGKGVSYMENTLKWHYSAPNDELLNQALEELK